MRWGAAARNERGLTMLELMIVVLILSVLLAVSIPSLVGARRRAAQRTAQSALRTVVLSARSLGLDEGTYLTVTSADLAADEPSIVIYPGNRRSTWQGEVSARSSVDGSAIFLAASDGNGTCFFIRDELSATDFGTTYASAPSPTACTGDAAAGLAAAAWKPTWKD